jgi:hypothetical protein
VSEALRAALRERDGLLGYLARTSAPASAGAAEPPLGPGPAQLAASGPRTAGHEADYELLLEMILEGSRLHYGDPRLIRPEDPDLALLLGDQLYALGLERLAGLGDIDAVAELGDVISLVAQAHAASDPELADAVWEAGAIAIGWGASDEYEHAKELARGEDPRALACLEATLKAGRS